MAPMVNYTDMRRWVAYRGRYARFFCACAYHFTIVHRWKSKHVGIGLMRERPGCRPQCLYLTLLCTALIDEGIVSFLKFDHYIERMNKLKYFLLVTQERTKAGLVAQFLLKCPQTLSQWKVTDSSSNHI